MTKSGAILKTQEFKARGAATRVINQKVTMLQQEFEFVSIGVYIRLLTIVLTLIFDFFSIALRARSIIDLVFLFFHRCFGNRVLGDKSATAFAIVQSL